MLRSIHGAAKTFVNGLGRTPQLLNACSTTRSPFAQLGGSLGGSRPVHISVRPGDAQMVLSSDEADGFENHLPPKRLNGFVAKRFETLLKTGNDGVALGLKPQSDEKVRLDPMGNHEGALRFEMPHDPQQRDAEVDIGNLSDSDIAALAKGVKECADDERYSLAGEHRGIPVEHWTRDELAEYFRTGVAPRGAPNSLDQFKTDVLNLARHKGASDPALVRRFESELQKTRGTMDALGVVTKYFGPDENGNCVFKAPPSQPLGGVDLRDTPFYEEYRKASGMEPQAFAKLVDNLSAKAGAVFIDVFDNPAYLRWGQDFFSKLRPMLESCAKGEAAGLALYFPDTYGVKQDEQGKDIKGTGVVHIATMAITPEGDVSVGHHESIDINRPGADKRGAVSHLMPGSLGVSADTLHTREHFERVERAMGVPSPDKLPIAGSVALWGPPSCVIRKLTNYEGFQKFVEEEAIRGHTPEALEMSYCASPDPRIPSAAAAYRRGELDLDQAVKAAGPRLALDPKIPGPGGSAPHHYSNNCAITTLLSFKRGGYPALDGMNPSADMPLVEQDEMLFGSGLMPDTPATMTQKMRKKEEEKPLGTGTFFVVASTKDGQTMQPGEGIRADVPRNASYERYLELDLDSRAEK